MTTFLTKIKPETSTNGNNRQSNHAKNTNTKFTEFVGEPIKEHISTELKFTENETKSTEKSKNSTVLDSSKNNLRKNSKTMCGKSSENNSKKRKRIIETNDSESDGKLLDNSFFKFYNLNTFATDVCFG